MIQIRPCPFCGAKDEQLRVEVFAPDRYAVRCLSCKATGPKVESKEQAAEKWVVASVENTLA